ncbi:MAG: VOC family protein [Anaerolineae bacterium]
MANSISWVEIGGKNPSELKEFYEKVFGWKMQAAPGMDYHMSGQGDMDHAGLGIGPESPMGPYVTFYIGVDDPQAYLDKAVAAGAHVVAPVTVVPDMVTFALFADPEGHVIGITKNSM